MKKIIRFSLLTLALTLTLTGCRSSKNTVPGMGKEELAAAKERYEAVIARNFPYETLQAKMKYSLGGGKALSGKLNIEHGKRLCMTVTILGIEVARVEADQENVTIVQKVDKVYARVPIAEAAAKLGLENEAKLDALEALLLGRIFVPGKGVAESSDFSKLTWYPMENAELQGDFLTEKYQLSYVMNDQNYLVATQVVTPNPTSANPSSLTPNRFVWEYANPIELSGGTMPTEETLSVSGARSLSANITMSAPSTAKKNWNSFSPGSNYRQVTLAELFETIKNLKN